MKMARSGRLSSEGLQDYGRRGGAVRKISQHPLETIENMKKAGEGRGAESMTPKVTFEERLNPSPE